MRIRGFTPPLAIIVMVANAAQNITSDTVSSPCLIPSARELSPSFRISPTVAFGQHSWCELYAIGGLFEMAFFVHRCDLSVFNFHHWIARKSP